jgi:hypothetical protein
LANLDQHQDQEDDEQQDADGLLSQAQPAQGGPERTAGGQDLDGRILPQLDGVLGDLDELDNVLRRLRALRCGRASGTADRASPSQGYTDWFKPAACQGRTWTLRRSY